MPGDLVVNEGRDQKQTGRKTLIDRKQLDGLDFRSDTIALD